LPDQNWDAITSEDLDAIRSFFPRPKFFIFGHARSGTTLLARLIKLHPEVRCNWQGRFVTHPMDGLTHFTDRSFLEWIQAPSNHWRNNRNLEVQIARAAIDFIIESDAVRLGKWVVGDKTPNLNNGLSIRRLHKIYPDAKVLFIVRDGRDVAISLRIADFVDRADFLPAKARRIRASLIKDSELYLNVKRSLFTYNWLVNIAERWSKNVHETTSTGLELYNDSLYSLHYESLLDDPGREIMEIWRFLGVENTRVDEKDIWAEASINPKSQEHSERSPEIVKGIPRGTSGVWR